MSTSFIDSLPASFVANVRAMCGRDGENWLEGLPELISKLESEWSIKADKPFTAIEFNYVAPASVDGENTAVLKISPPWDNREIFCEAAFLRAKNGRGCVRSLGEKLDDRAILIERALPGESFANHFSGREMEAVGPSIAVFRSVLGPWPTDEPDVILLSDWFDGMRRSASKPGFPTEYAQKALDIYDELSPRSPDKYLHGDLHPGNMVTATREPFLAIDPKGIVGNLGYDIGVYLNNFIWWNGTRPDLTSRLNIVVAQFAEAFEIEPNELRKWAYPQMVLSAWWMFDEMPDIYDNEVVKADVWDV